MNLSKLFKSSKDFQLDKSTFVNLRWIALLGQFATINVVKLIFQFDFYFLLCNFIVGIGVLTNLLLQFKIKQNQLNNNLSTIYLAYDIIQLGILIYLTGGINNPFIFLLIIPSVFSSTYLKLISTINLVIHNYIYLNFFNFFSFRFTKSKAFTFPCSRLLFVCYSIGNNCRLNISGLFWFKIWKRI